MFVRFTTTHLKPQIIALNTEHITHMEDSPGKTRTVIHTTTNDMYTVQGSLYDNTDRINNKLTERN